MSSEEFDLRLAAPFVVLAEELHFGRAAARLGAKQPALSQQLARLERQLGVRLIDRDGRQVTLTSAGARFLPEVREMLARVVLAETALRGGDGGGELRVDLGAAAHPVIGDILRSFIAAQPGLVVDAVGSSSTRAAQAVRIGEADVGFSHPGDVPDLGHATVASGPLGVFTALDHPIARRGSATWTDLEGETVFFGVPGMADGYFTMLRTTLRRAGVRVREIPALGAPRPTYMIHMITTGAAVMVVASWTIEPLPPGLAWTLLEPEQLMEVVVAWNEDTANEPARRFAAWARARGESPDESARWTSSRRRREP